MARGDVDATFPMNGAVVFQDRTCSGFNTMLHSDEGACAGTYASTAFNLFICINGVSAICKFSRLNAVKAVTSRTAFSPQKQPIKAPS
jgi:hypothetical protein